MSELFRLELRVLASRARLLGLSVFAVIPILVAVGLRAGGTGNDTTPADAAYSLVNAYGLSILTPVVALVFASAALGDPVEDGTLVYMWLRPVARWRLTLAAMGAVLCIAVPLAVVPTVAAAAIAGVGADLVRAAAVASGLAVVAYAAVFLALGFRVRRALVWGLAYVLVWEGAVARVARGAARLSIGVHARSLLARIAGHAPPRVATSSPVAVTVPIVVAALALALTVWWVARAEVA